MSPGPRAPAVARSLALAVAGGREAAVALEALEREAEDAPEDCARAAIGRYNGKNDRAPDRAPGDDHEA